MPRKELPPRVEKIGEVYYVLYSEHGRSQRASLRTEDFQVAQTRFIGWLEEREKDIAARQRVTFDYAFDLYFKQHAERKCAKPEIIKIEGNNLKEHFGEMLLEDIKLKDILAYTKKCQQGYSYQTEDGVKYRRPVSNGTIRKELAIMRATFKFMCDRVEPVELRADAKKLCYIEFPSRPPARDRVLTPGEIARLLSAAALPNKPAKVPRVSLFVWLLLETGARAGALTELTWDQVDFENRRIQLNPAGRTQTKKRRPIVPISDRLLPVLARAKAEAALPDGSHRHPWVLTHPGSVRTALDTLLKKAGLEDVTPHTFRHTLATRLAQAGVPMVEIAAMLGDSVKTVEENYLHLSPGYLRKAVNALAKDRRETEEEESVV